MRAFVRVARFDRCFGPAAAGNSAICAVCSWGGSSWRSLRGRPAYPWRTPTA